MPRRKRPDLRAARAAAGAGDGPAAPAVDADVAMFARRTQEADAARHQARRDARAAKHRAEEGARLQVAKDGAAQNLKAVRRKQRPHPGEADAAESAYRAALAALMTFETGTRPGWADTPAGEPEGVGEAEAAASTTDGDDPEEPSR